MGDAPGALWSHPQLAAAVLSEDWSAVFRAYRKLTGLSQSRLGERVGLVQPDVSDIERGRRRVTSVEVRQRIVEGLGIPSRLQAAAAPMTTGKAPVASLTLSGPAPDADLLARVTSVVDSAHRGTLPPWIGLMRCLPHTAEPKTELGPGRLST
nr:helix-turn-helix transcriptional regulator [Streptomyces sp. GMR22]